MTVSSEYLYSHLSFLFVILGRSSKFTNENTNQMTKQSVLWYETRCERRTRELIWKVWKSQDHVMARKEIQASSIWKCNEQDEQPCTTNYSETLYRNVCRVLVNSLNRLEPWNQETVTQKNFPCGSKKVKWKERY